MREKNYEEVLKVIKKVQIIEKESGDSKTSDSLKKHQERCFKELKKQEEKQKQMYSKMFAAAAGEPAIKKTRTKGLNFKHLEFFSLNLFSRSSSSDSSKRTDENRRK
jgi:hypothetical protein